MADTKAVVQTIKYLLQKTGNLDKLKIVKLVYLADKMHLMLYGRTITGDSYCVMKNGPVGSTTLDVLNENLEYLEEKDIEYSKQFISRLSSDSIIYKATPETFDLEMLSESDTKVLDTVIDKLSGLSSKELVELTHKYPEWKQYEDDFMNQSRKHADIRIEDLFSTIENDPIGVEPALIECSKEFFLGCE